MSLNHQAMQVLVDSSDWMQSRYSLFSACLASSSGSVPIWVYIDIYGFI